MKKAYESPTFEIDWFESESALAAIDVSNTTDWIPDNPDSDDEFG